jgi:hypothetical protein
MPTFPPLPPLSADATSRPELNLWTAHGEVLLLLAAFPGSTVREVAEGSGLALAFTRRVLHELEAAHLVHVQRGEDGHRYRINPNARFPHPTLQFLTVHQVLGHLRGLLAPPDSPAN